MTETQAERSEFDPPPPGGLRRALGWAILAHVLLILALTWGLRWKKDNSEAVDAELWAAAVQQAAPAPRPAVIAYNRFAREIDRLAIKMETFIEEFSNILQRNLGVHPAPAAAPIESAPGY